MRDAAAETRDQAADKAAELRDEAADKAGEVSGTQCGASQELCWSAMTGPMVTVHMCSMHTACSSPQCGPSTGRWYECLCPLARGAMRANQLISLSTGSTRILHRQQAHDGYCLNPDSSVVKS